MLTHIKATHKHSGRDHSKPFVRVVTRKRPLKKCGAKGGGDEKDYKRRVSSAGGLTHEKKSQCGETGKEGGCLLKNLLI